MNENTSSLGAEQHEVAGERGPVGERNQEVAPDERRQLGNLVERGGEDAHALACDDRARNASSTSERSWRHARTAKPPSTSAAIASPIERPAPGSRIACSGSSASGRLTTAVEPRARWRRTRPNGPSGSRAAHAQHVAPGRAVVDQPRDRAIEPHGPGGEEGDAVGEAADLVDPLGRPQHRRAARGEQRDEQADPLGTLGVEVVGRLVDEQHVGLGQQRAGDRQALLHAVRPAVHGPVGGVLEADGGEHGARPGHGLTAPEAVQPREEDEVLDARQAQVEGPVPGGDEAHAVAQLARAEPLAAEQRHAPAGGRGEAGEDAGERRLARAVGPEQGVDAAGVQRHRHAVERDGVAEAARERGRGHDGGRRLARLDHLSVPARPGRPLAFDARHPRPRSREHPNNGCCRGRLAGGASRRRARSRRRAGWRPTRRGPASAPRPSRAPAARCRSGRTSTRPRPSSAALSRPTSASTASTACVSAARSSSADVDERLRELLHRVALVQVAALERLHRQQRGGDAVARRHEAGVDDVAGLLAPQAPAALAQRLEHVAVADRRGGDLDAARLHRLVEADSSSSRSRRRPPRRGGWRRARSARRRRPRRRCGRRPARGRRRRRRRSRRRGRRSRRAGGRGAWTRSRR